MAVHFAILRAPRQLGDTEAGVWLYDLKGETPRQIFRGWATRRTRQRMALRSGFPSTTNSSLAPAQAWLDGSPPVQTRTALRLNFALPDVSAPSAANYFRFDVHPDHKRIVVEAFRFQESDISMIENIR